MFGRAGAGGVASVVMANTADAIGLAAANGSRRAVKVAALSSRLVAADVLRFRARGGLPRRLARAVSITIAA